VVRIPHLINSVEDVYLVEGRLALITTQMQSGRLRQPIRLWLPGSQTQTIERRGFPVRGLSSSDNAVAQESRANVAVENSTSAVWLAATAILVDSAVTPILD